MRLAASTALCLRIAISFVNSEICQPSNAAIPDKTSNNTKPQMSTANALGTFFSSIHLQKGKNSVAKTAPIVKGIKKFLAKCNPAKTRNRISSIFITEEDVVVILNPIFHIHFIVFFFPRFYSQPHSLNIFMVLNGLFANNNKFPHIMNYKSK